jgi:hypothetical protein
MFPLVRTGTLPLDTDIDAASLPIHLAECLRCVDARKVEIQGNCVAFEGGMFRLVGNWNVLVPFESGDLRVEASSCQIRYTLSIRQLVLFGTGAVVIMSFIILKMSMWQPLLVLPLMWLWLVGVNLAIGIARFKNFLRRASATAPHLARKAPWNLTWRE